MHARTARPRVTADPVGTRAAGGGAGTGTAVDTVVIGAGQAGLAMSWHLAQHGRDHVVLERGKIANRWQTAGWDSLRLLTPNWMSRLPGWSYQGADPDGYLPASELVDYLLAYARSFNAPVRTGSTVRSVRREAAHYRVDTERDSWSAINVVVATGACTTPYLPTGSSRLSPALNQVTPADYRNPVELAAGGVLVVGASSSGVQIAQELRRTGRRVVLSCGRHTRVPRSYRGMDIWWWLDQLGRLDRSIEDMSDAGRARTEPSLQLVGRPVEDLDLGILTGEGVEVTGRLIAMDADRVVFAAEDLHRSAAAADARLRRLLDAVDSFVAQHGLRDEVLQPTPYRPISLAAGVRELDLRAAGIQTVIWATGYRPGYPWLQVPVFDASGQLRQYRGRTPSPGLYCVGLPFGQRRNSSLLDGVRHDAVAVVAHLTGDRCRGMVAQAGPR